MRSLRRASQAAATASAASSDSFRRCSVLLTDRAFGHSAGRNGGVGGKSRRRTSRTVSRTYNLDTERGTPYPGEQRTFEQAIRLLPCGEYSPYRFRTTLVCRAEPPSGPCPSTARFSMAESHLRAAVATLLPGKCINVSNGYICLTGK